MVSQPALLQTHGGWRGGREISIDGTRENMLRVKRCCILRDSSLICWHFTEEKPSQSLSESWTLSHGYDMMIYWTPFSFGHISFPLKSSRGIQQHNFPPDHPLLCLQHSFPDPTGVFMPGFLIYSPRAKSVHVSDSSTNWEYIQQARTCCMVVWLLGGQWQNCTGPKNNQL